MTGEYTPRVFESLNHPEPEADGTFRYTLYEVFHPSHESEMPKDARYFITDDGQTLYVVVADNQTLRQVSEYVNANGVYRA